MDTLEIITGGRAADLPNQPFQGRMLIGGTWVEAADGARITRDSPAHGVPVASYPAAKQTDAGRAVEAARNAFDEGPWPRMKGAERAAVLRRVADEITRRAEELARWEVLESGKPISQARGEMAATAELWHYAAALARGLHGDSYNTLGEDMLGVTLREPVGVVALITPWNFPLLIISQKLPFALAAGCTAVVKPSELTSTTTLILGEILQKAGVPEGAVNIITGTGPEAGAPIVSHPAVDMVSFTGSTRVGKMTAMAAAGTLKKIALELGGKNPQIVFPDCDWEAALDAVVFGVYFNAGECCNSGSRVLVHADIAARFTEAVVERARKVPVGEPLNPRTKVGAIINHAQLDKILGYVHEARSAGATVHLGGERIDGGAGLFVQPTVIGKVHRNMNIARGEVFGPGYPCLHFKMPLRQLRSPTTRFTDFRPRSGAATLTPALLARAASRRARFGSTRSWTATRSCPSVAIAKAASAANWAARHWRITPKPRRCSCTSDRVPDGGCRGDLRYCSGLRFAIRQMSGRNRTFTTNSRRRKCVRS